MLGNSIDEELDDDYETIILTSSNPVYDRSLVRYDYQSMEYRFVGAPSSTVVLFSQKSSLTSARMEDKILESINKPLVQGRQTQLQYIPKESRRLLKQESRASEESRDEEDAQVADSASVSLSKDTHSHEVTRKLINRFQFSERSTLTIKKVSKEKGIQADPPAKLTFTTNASQWEIYDGYLKDIQKQEKAKERKASDNSTVSKYGSGAATDAQRLPQPMDLSSLLHVAKVVERMVSQNVYNDITIDFKFWEDPSDEYREPQGSMLPLWKFCPSQNICKTVTALNWNSKYPDLFAAAYGSYDISDQGPGFICLFSLKCPSAAEKIYKTESGAFCLDFNHQAPYLLAVGLANGNVIVYSLKAKQSTPIYKSGTILDGHLDPVWKVEWLKNENNIGHTFASISGDGTVIMWTTVKATLQPTKLLTMKTRDIWTDGSPCMRIEIISCGTAIALRQNGRNPGSDFLVGTEQGKIQLCSVLYLDKVRKEYVGHSGVVHQLQWNHFHHDIFISCSTDWMVYIWEINIQTPVMSFDLKCEVNDVAWAPYSATVFAAITVDGKVHVYDVAVNRYLPICQQKVLTRKASATKLAFNLSYPVLIIGSDRGQIYSMKLSPNLRLNLTEPCHLEDQKFRQSEKERMEVALKKAKALIYSDSP